MSTISFNNGTPMEITNFNKRTQYNADTQTVNKTANVNFPDASSEDVLEGFMTTPITSITIYNANGDVVYNSTNLNAKVTSINESYYSDRLNVEAYLVF